MEDVNDNYTYQDLIIYLLKTEPYRMREFVYLCFVVGFLSLFVDKNFIFRERQSCTKSNAFIFP